jgi:hypothetical protein
VVQACQASVRRLGVDTIDLYFQHRVHRMTPIEETVGAKPEQRDDRRLLFSLWAIAGDRADEGGPAVEGTQQPLVVGPQDAPTQLGERHVVGIIGGREVVLLRNLEGAPIQGVRCT